jgi:hypothetical protein
MPMGIPEALYGVGALILLAALVYAVMRGKRRSSQQPAADAATRRNFDAR